MTPPPALALQAVTVTFGRTTALDRVDFALRRGTVHALLGENGAGKTTLMRVAFGLHHPDAGTISVDGRPRSVRRPADAIAAGIGMVQQHYSSAGELTVAENVALGGRGLLDRRAAEMRVRETTDRFRLPLDPGARADSLSVGGQQRLELVKALSRDARILILDEPTAVLPPGEAQSLLAWLRGFADGGGSVVLITHALRDAVAAADDVTVLRRGHVELTGPMRTYDAAALATAMVGSAPVAAVRRPHRRAPGSGDLRLRSRQLVVHREPPRRSVGPVDLDVRAGEIVGFAGVEGAGHHELLEALAGRRSGAAGTLETDSDAAWIPEDRLADAVIGDFSLTENLALRHAGTRRGRSPWASVSLATSALIRDYDVRGGTPDTRLRQLSGGNQQKFVVGRELAAAPQVVIAVNPTRGLDVRSAAEVLDRLLSLADAGAAVLFSSADLDEVLASADRVIVAHDGSFREAPPDRAIVGALMAGHLER